MWRSLFGAALAAFLVPNNDEYCKQQHITIDGSKTLLADPPGLRITITAKTTPRTAKTTPAMRVMFDLTAASTTGCRSMQG